MKKMVCEICESKSIKKENGIFVCQECGTEYSLEDAKKLLKEIEEDIKYEVEEKTSTIKNEVAYSERSQKKGELLNVLLMWADVIKKLMEQKGYTFYISVEKYWEGDIEGGRRIPQLGDNYFKDKLLDSYLLNNARFFTRPYFGYNDEFGPVNGNLNKAHAIYLLSRVKEKAYKVLEWINKSTELHSKVIEEKQKEIKALYKNAKIIIISDLFKHINFRNPFFVADDAIAEHPHFFTNITKEEVCDYLKILDFVNHFYDSTFENVGAPYIKDPIEKINEVEMNYSYRKILLEKDETVFVDLGLNLDELKALLIDLNEAYEKEAIKLVDKLENMISYRREDVLGLVNYAKELAKEFYLPIKYRSLDTLIPLIELVIDGRAETWMDAINLFEDEQFKAKLTNKIDNLGSKLDQLTKSINNLYTETIRSSSLQYLTNLQLSKISRQITFANRLELYKQFDII